MTQIYDSPAPDEVERAYENAIGDFVGADWEHPYKRGDPSEGAVVVREIGRARV